MLFLGFCAHAQNPKNFNGYLISGRAQGSTYQIKYYHNDFIVNKQSIDSIFSIIDQSMSIYQKESTISLFNNNQITQIQIDKHFKNVIKTSFRINKLTKGYFDITIMPLINLWGFGPKGFYKNPTKHQVDSVMSFVGSKHLKLKGNILTKTNPNVAIDVNGIAQGYTVDVIAKYLESKGIKNYLVEVGGEIKGKGKKPEGNFLVEVARPHSDKQYEKHVIVANNIAITTSGTYEKRRRYEGKFISHHINPITGYPVQNSTVSVTVIAKDAITADALDNYFMFLDPREAITVAEKMKNIEIYLVFIENNIVIELETSKFNNYIYTNQ